MFTDDQRPLYELKANLFKGLAHPYRIRVLEILAATPQVSVSEILADMGLEASHLSQHLAVLRRYGMVVSERQANVVNYRLAYPQVADLLKVARELLAELLETSDVQRGSFKTLPQLTVGEGR
ncbi:ArsR/SmtB family transcription factor [Corynebacterium sp. A21]|uniref:ArsR/SmtB family transcription factor n=1 Tax=Corynebacterium sp. A21 TaxID=3457318 RepID=UPI003FD30EC4